MLTNSQKRFIEDNPNIRICVLTKLMGCEQYLVKAHKNKMNINKDNYYGYGISPFTGEIK